MSSILEAAWEIHRFLARAKIPYVFIGGIAVQTWSEPRATDDVDLTVSVPVEESEKFIELIEKSFRARIFDLAYIRAWLKEFSLILEADEVLNRFEKMWAKWKKGG